MHAVELAALLHLKFVTIHPFGDGNGRISRLLAGLAMLSLGINKTFMISSAMFLILIPIALTLGD